MGTFHRAGLAALATMVLCGALAGPAAATDLSGALVGAADCTQHQLDRNDDGSTSSIALPFAVDFYGTRYDRLWVNNNGNVTFDAPLSTYTPFGLQAAARAIIAPFFADVDTRASGSDIVRYGYGETTYQGRRAFCVNWINVGYYNARADKLNSFQLLLVDRGGGDFDIVFNYGSITWETGDASGGTGGLGGDSARVGFANGDGSTVNSFELPGSGIDGFLLDSNPRGLIHGHGGDTTQDGRYVYAIRNGRPGPDRYVALGDSYQSGEGAGSYQAGTAVNGVNECHRSDHAYPQRLVDDGTIPFELDFRACSGATIADLGREPIRTDGPPWNDDAAQLEYLRESTALVTLGIGGNDLGFADTLTDCIVKNVHFRSCESSYDDDVMDRLLAMQSHATPDGLDAFQRIYNDVRSRAWRARTVVLGYPRFFTVDGGRDFSSLLDGLLGGAFGDGRCQSIRASDQIWINHKIRLVDNAIAAAARSMGADYAPMYDVPGGHELCGEDPSFLNGIRFTNRVESFHPNEYGHERIADRLRGTLEAAPDGDLYTIHPGETIDVPFNIGSILGLAFSTVWPGSDVEMTLISPSGRVIDRSTTAADVFHRNGPTQEVYDVRHPESGRWTVRLHGLDVDPEGEPVRLSSHQEPIPNRDPAATLALQQTGKRTIAVSAAGSTDADGEVVDHLWDFGDGSYATGAQATHTFPGPGTYRVTLVIKDDDGGLGFATATHDIEVVAYPFAGFSAPVDDPPVVNTMRAGRAVPVKFSLGGDRGLGIFDPGYPKVQRVDCESGAITAEVEVTETAGESSLAYDAATQLYHYTWKTDAAWANSCRRLIVGLDDGTRRTAEFRFR